MGYVFCLFVAAGFTLWVVRRTNKKDQATYTANFWRTFTGVYPVFPNGPTDSTVRERASEAGANFVKHGNSLPKQVQPYFFNGNVRAPDGNYISTASADYTQSMILFTRDYLRRCDEFHAKYYSKDESSAEKVFSWQGTGNGMHN